jgi:hypothetical protein
MEFSVADDFDVIHRKESSKKVKLSERAIRNVVQRFINTLDYTHRQSWLNDLEKSGDVRIISD